MRQTKPGVRRRLKWGWHLSEGIKEGIAILGAFLAAFLFLAAPIVVVCVTNFGPIRQDGNPVWTTGRIIWFAILGAPIGALLAGGIGCGIYASVDWLAKHPPIRITEESPDLREIYHDGD